MGSPSITGSLCRATSACPDDVSGQTSASLLAAKGTPNDLHGAKLPRCSWALSDGRIRRYHCDEGRHSYRCDGKLVQFCVVVAAPCPLQHCADLEIVCSLERCRHLCDQFTAGASYSDPVEETNLSAKPALMFIGTVTAMAMAVVLVSFLCKKPPTPEASASNPPTALTDR
jgi:hypothetical protein